MRQGDTIGAPAARDRARADARIFSDVVEDAVTLAGDAANAGRELRPRRGRILEKIVLQIRKTGGQAAALRRI